MEKMLQEITKESIVIGHVFDILDELTFDERKLLAQLLILLEFQDAEKLGNINLLDTSEREIHRITRHLLRRRQCYLSSNL
jgi:hypothetical protein